MLKRVFLQGTPKVVYESINEHAKIQLWPVSGVQAMKKGSPIYINKNAQQCDPAHGIPLPVQPIIVEVFPGETLFAVSEDVGLLGMSIEFVVNRKR